jgi:hypothetical protein
MKSIDLSDVSALSPFLRTEANEPLFVTENGHTVAAVVPVNEDDVEDLLLSINPQFQAILEKSQRRMETEGSLTSQEVRSRLGLPPSNQ